MTLEPAPGPGPEPYRITQVRGPMARRFRAMVLLQAGEEGWRGLLARVGPACRAAFEGDIGAFEWVDGDLVAELGEAWERLGGEGSTARRGQGAAREILDGTHPWLRRLATPWLLVQVLPRLFAFYYRGAELLLEVHEEGRACFALRASGYYATWFTEGVPATAAEVLRMAGAGEVEVRHRPPGAGDPAWLHRYELRWRV